MHIASCQTQDIRCTYLNRDSEGLDAIYIACLQLTITFYSHSRHRSRYENVGPGQQPRMDMQYPTDTPTGSTEGMRLIYRLILDGPVLVAGDREGRVIR